MDEGKPGPEVFAVSDGRDFACTGALVGVLSSALISSISEIGVTPAIGSLENSPIRNAKAPASLPLRYTGLPLIPATTPVYSALVPPSRTRMMSPFGPLAFLSTPRTSTSIDSGFVPWNTV